MEGLKRQRATVKGGLTRFINQFKSNEFKHNVSGIKDNTWKKRISFWYAWQYTDSNRKISDRRGWNQRISATAFLIRNTVV